MNISLSALGVACLLPFLLSCAGEKKKAAERTCEVRGEVMRLDSQVRTATVKHEKICDWMEPMTMEFPVREAKDFELLKPGARITATIHIGDPDFWLSDVRIVK
jgi:Cu/Ag efflux protein CusF